MYTHTHIHTVSVKLYSTLSILWTVHFTWPCSFSVLFLFYFILFFLERGGFFFLEWLPLTVTGIVIWPFKSFFFSFPLQQTPMFQISCFSQCFSQCCISRYNMYSWDLAQAGISTTMKIEMIDSVLFVFIFILLSDKPVMLQQCSLKPHPVPINQLRYGMLIMLVTVKTITKH